LVFSVQEILTVGKKEPVRVYSKRRGLALITASKKTLFGSFLAERVCPDISIKKDFVRIFSWRRGFALIAVSKKTLFGSFPSREGLPSQRMK